jgi:hypothetical protein
MTEGPTTENGPLHATQADLADRLITATFASPAAADAARARLVHAGIDPARIAVVANAAAEPQVHATLQPRDTGVISRIREVLSPEDSNTALRDAVRQNDAILELRPWLEEVELAVEIIQASNPTHFDADLQRWRNKA